MRYLIVEVMPYKGGEICYEYKQDSNSVAKWIFERLGDITDSTDPEEVEAWVISNRVEESDYAHEDYLTCKIFDENLMQTDLDEFDDAIVEYIINKNLKKRNSRLK